MSAEFSHEPVLLNECIDNLKIDKDGIYIDCTAGGGGHSIEILKRLSDKGLLIAIDRDQNAVDRVNERLRDANLSGRYIVVKDNYLNIEKIKEKYAPEGVAGILMDLGVSSHQLDTIERGFSYHEDAPLDMRMDISEVKTAYDVVNYYTKDELSRILWDYGEEKYARKIASAIEYKRKIKLLETTLELTELVKSCYPPNERFKGKHPARKTFQAIRIEVNEELSTLSKALESAAEILLPGGRLAVITFHSLEDRITKVLFSKLENPCECPPDFPVCVCHKVSMYHRVNRKPILPSGLEINDNRRSRSAKLRVLERNQT
ncbi:MAG: 16S rRNA (cytosine(1402)-N(4))-methyltransferase RsmH [Clostridia bacterium]|nr:16S rRNA (cytosine(1402)-N(4))-methyltransferase RsmH [Clostridia bacterium]